MKQIPRVVLAVGAVVFGAVALTSVRADAADPCSMLSPDKVAAALGVPDVKTPGGTNGCVWVPRKVPRRIEARDDGSDGDERDSRLSAVVPT